MSARTKVVLSLFVAAIQVLVSSQPLLAVPDPAGNNNNSAVMPARAVLVPAALETKKQEPPAVRQPAPKPSGPSKVYDKLGRVVGERTADYYKVFTYHANGYSVFEENKTRGSYTIKEYINGALFSTTSSTGEFLKYSGRDVIQRITADGNVYDYFYTQRPDGTRESMTTFLNGKFNVKTTYLSKNSYKEEYANGNVNLYRDGLLRYSKEGRTGFEWNYAYIFDKHGQMDQRIATRVHDGRVVVIDYSNRRNDQSKNAPVNFQQVQKAALESVAKGTAEAKTNDGNAYKLASGALVTMDRAGKAVYVFVDRVLTEIRHASGLVIRVDSSGAYRRV